jgi:signal transduction histidine kinase
MLDREARMMSLGAIRSAAAISGLALLAGLSLTLGAHSAGAPALGLIAAGSLVGLVAIVTAAARPRPLAAPRDGTPVARSRPSRGGVAAAGTAMVCGLLLAITSHGPRTAGLEIVLAGLVSGVVLAVPAVVPTLRRMLWQAIVIGLVGAAVVVLVRLVVGSHVGGYVWLLLALIGAGAAGLLLLADALATGERGENPDRSAWSLVTSTARRRSSTSRRAVAGGLMVLWATALAVGLAATHVVGNPVLVALVVLGVAIAAAVVIGTPLLVTAFVSRQRLAAERTRETERLRIAAHLHDSVLQTLALVQRQASDPDAVTRLAHRQELSLRSWMAGESELAPGSLAAALQTTINEVGDAAEVSIELSMVGDRPTESRDEALVAATKEALRNATRHARGSPVAVYAEVIDEGVEVYVSDAGPGFILDEIPETRRGVRDAILARMQAAGGSAEILAEQGHGTEVILRLPAT